MMIGLLLVALMLMSVMLSAAIGKGRFCLQCDSGQFSRRPCYGEWVEKLFAGLSTAGFLPLAFMALAECFAWLARDNSEKPFILSGCVIAIFATCYYYGILAIARNCESNYRWLEEQDYVPSCEQECDTVQLAKPKVELDIINPNIRASVRGRRIEPRERVQKYYEVDAPSRYQGWGVVRPAEQAQRETISGSLALDVTEVEEPQAMPATNPDFEPEELLELKLKPYFEGLPKEDYDLVLEYFREHNELIELVLSPKHQVSISFVPATEVRPRHIQVHGIVYRTR